MIPIAMTAARLGVITLASLLLCAQAKAQNVTDADRTVSAMAGAYRARDNIPVFSSRLRFQTAPYGAAEFELGIARGSERACPLIGLGPCSERHYPVFLSFLTYGVSVPLSRTRPYAQAGVGVLASTDSDLLLLGVASAGIAVRVTNGWGLRLEVGRRFDSEDGATHFLAGFEFAWH